MPTLLDAISDVTADNRQTPLWRHSLPFVAGMALFADNLIWSVNHVPISLLLSSTLLYVIFIKSHFSAFKIHTSAILLLALCCLLHLLNRLTLQIQILSLSLLLFFYYALAGFYLRHSDWQKLQLPTLFVFLIFPFFDYIEIFFGFPLRLLAANIASDLLASFHLPVFGNGDLLFIDNRYMQVDVDCSGIKGLWTGMVFYIVMSWIYNRKLTSQWLASLFMFVFSLLLFNALRIAIIAWVELVLGKPKLAAMIHEPLGLVGFVLACLFAWFLVSLPVINWQTQLLELFSRMPDRFLKPPTDWINQISNFTRIKLKRIPRRISTDFDDKWKTANLVGLILLLPATLALLAPPYDLVMNKTTLTPTLVFPTGWSNHPVDLNAQEKRFFAGKHVAVDKLRFSHKQRDGSLILVSSNVWKTQHHPKHCLQAQGFTVIQDQSTRLGNSTRIRQLLLTKNHQLYTAIFWWQSANTQTDDYGKRIFSSLMHPHDNWTMVSILVKGRLIDSQLNELADIILPQITQSYRLQHDYQSQGN